MKSQDKLSDDRKAAMARIAAEKEMLIDWLFRRWKLLNQQEDALTMTYKPQGPPLRLVMPERGRIRR